MSIPPASNPPSNQVSQQNSSPLFHKTATILLCIGLSAGGALLGTVIIGVPPFPGVSGFISRIISLSTFLVAVLGLGLISWKAPQSFVNRVWKNANRKVSFTCGIVALLATVAFLITLPYWYFDPYVHQGVPSFTDHLRTQTQQSLWEVEPAEPGCFFTERGLQDNASSLDRFHTCVAQNTNFGNFIYQIQMTIIKGDCGGIAFRVDQTRWRQYLFYICRDARAFINLYTSARAFGVFGDAKPLWHWSNLSSIHTGLGQSNTIAVVANASGFDLWVNHQQLAPVRDNTLLDGSIGVVAYDLSQPTEVVFSDAQVWET